MLVCMLVQMMQYSDADADLHAVLLPAHAGADMDLD